MSELKCCPFCGGKVTAYADRYEKVMIECDNCKMYFGVWLEIGCELKDGWKATLNSKQEAINAWNTRKHMDNIVEKLKELKMRYFLTIANTGDDKNDFAYENVGNALDNAIRIVKYEMNNGLE